MVGAGNIYFKGAEGGTSTVTLTVDNLPKESLRGIGYVVNGIYSTWQGNIGTLSGEYRDQASVRGSDSWQSYRYYTSLESLALTRWKGQAFNILPPYHAVYYIMRIK